MKIIGLSVFINNENTEYTLCLLDKHKKYIMKNNNLQEVERFPLIHYIVKSYDDINDVFELSTNFINMDYFNLAPRFKEIKRKVWIFQGESILGKTFLSDQMNLSKYETDTSSELPKVFKEEIIVVGNKHKFSIEDIKNRIYNKENVDVIIVSFKKD